LLRRQARRRLARSETASPARSQQRLLLQLLEHNQTTTFAHDHDFSRIRSARDFCRLVPLRTRSVLSRLYPVFPQSGDPGQVFLTALGQAWRRQHFTLLDGKILQLVEPGADRQWLLAHLPWWVRPYLTVTAAPRDEDEVRTLLETGARAGVTGLLATRDQLDRLVEQTRNFFDRDALTHLWQRLAIVGVVHPTLDVDRAELVEMIGCARRRPPVVTLACQRPWGILALDDPGCGPARMLVDHGVYFEFVPMEDLGQANPRRLSVEEVVEHRPYALAVTTGDGCWACLCDEVVEFADAATLQLASVRLGLALPQEEVIALPFRSDAPAAADPGQPPHPPHTGKAGAPPRRFSRMPWSGYADQG
jgi:hypothetical protein